MNLLEIGSFQGQPQVEQQRMDTPCAHVSAAVRACEPSQTALDGQMERQQFDSGEVYAEEFHQIGEGMGSVDDQSNFVLAGEAFGQDEGAFLRASLR